MKGRHFYCTVVISLLAVIIMSNCSNELEVSIVTKDNLQILKDGEVVASSSDFDSNFNSSTQYIELAKRKDFAINLAKQVGTCEENFLLSPLSIQIAFAMLANGAEGNSYKEITEAIGMQGLSREQLREFGKLLLSHYLVSAEENASTGEQAHELQISNSVWTKEYYPVYESFFTSSRNFFDAEIHAVDFLSNSAESSINKWVKDKTNGKITEIVRSSDIQDLVLLLVNTIYMKASWNCPFEEVFTGTFKNSKGTTSQREMMHTRGYFKYATCADYDIASIMLANNAYAMSFILPHNDANDDIALGKLNTENISLNTTKIEYLDLEIPKFKCECNLDLLPILQGLGIHEVFSSNANLQALSPSKVFVSKSKHNTYIDVNEDGLEAAASTYIGIVDGEGPEDDITPVEFHVNRPFLFTIQDTDTGGVIFVGRIKNLE